MNDLALKELMIMASAILPKDKIIEDIKESAEEYLANPTKEAENKLGMLCMILTIGQATNGEIDNAKDLIDELKMHESRNKLFETGKN